MKVTEEMIERGARALLATYAGQDAADRWQHMPVGARKWWKEKAKAVLEAALGGEPSEDVQQGRA